MGELYALTSAGGAPGTTTAAIALALTWPSPVIVAECDPSGGDILAGLLAGHVPARRGLMELAIEAGRSYAAATAGLPGQLVPLAEDQNTMVLPGLTDPRQAAGLGPAWPAVASALTAQRADVIADCGRLDPSAEAPLGVLAAARAVVIVVRPSLRQVWAARPRVDMLLALHADASRLALLVTGEGSYSRHEVAQALGLPVAAVLPHDARTAALLSDGVGRRRGLLTSPLLRSASAAGRALRTHWPSPATGEAPEESAPGEHAADFAIAAASRAAAVQGGAGPAEAGPWKGSRGDD
ncbi:MAG TPA: hypothetical protein VGI58_09700 [Streptosporangiaceae bacterium]